MALVVGSCVVILRPQTAEWLVRSLPVPKCDLMVVLGGGVHERISSAVDLMMAGACGSLMLTGPDTRVDAQVPLSELSDSQRRYQIEVAISTSTMEDAVVALRGAQEGGFRSVLVVTSPYHTRRAEWIFSRVFAGSGIKFGMHPSDNLYFDYRHWWKSRDGRDAVMSEYAKLCLCGMLSDLLIECAATLS